MQHITIADPAWFTTFPHRVACKKMKGLRVYCCIATRRITGALA